MCGIFAYVGGKPAAPQVFAGLRRLAYRGYDSWGVVAQVASSLQCEKAVGSVPTLEMEPKVAASVVALGHTRWATHGGVTKANAHPHLAKDNSFALVHNGIVENSRELAAALKKQGHEFISQTDSEVLVRQVEQFLTEKLQLQEALRITAKRAEGRNTFAVLTLEGVILAVRNGSPLVVGRSSGGEEILLSSDSLSLGAACSEILVVENGQIVQVQDGKVKLFTVSTGKPVKANFAPHQNQLQDLNKAGYAHFMLKEIHESAQTLQAVVAQSQVGLDELSQAIKNAKTVYTIGSGTAGAAAAQIGYYLRTIANVNAISLIGAESQSYWSLFRKGDLIIAPSQSGETADVLEVLEHAQQKGVKIASYVNMAGSMMTRMSDFPFMAGAGPEVCVMSTKIFLSQCAWGFLLAHSVASTYSAGITQLRSAAAQIDILLADTQLQQQLRALAKTLANSTSLFLLGKGQLMEIAREGMVKIIEGSYVHAHAIPAGDLKHYAITLMQSGVPVLVLTAQDAVLKDIESAAHEVSARGAQVYSLGSASLPMAVAHVEIADFGEASALVTIVPVQLLAYYMAVEKGNPLDTPRNIAKSVTVK